jgi:hypothetical protein
MWMSLKSKGLGAFDAGRRPRGGSYARRPHLANPMLSARDHRFWSFLPFRPPNPPLRRAPDRLYKLRLLQLR